MSDTISNMRLQSIKMMNLLKGLAAARTASDVFSVRRRKVGSDCPANKHRRKQRQLDSNDDCLSLRPVRSQLERSAMYPGDADR